jgi:hypothetical protein
MGNDSDTIRVYVELIHKCALSAVVVTDKRIDELINPCVSLTVAFSCILRQNIVNRVCELDTTGPSELEKPQFERHTMLD